ncbi:MAG: hypothetical protein J7603_11475 [Pseudacidovorax sp.]|nr:hypothetical protein [Pseudacidovorax sp.]
MPSTTPAVEGAPTLRLEITDLLANAGGMYGGPKIVQLHGTLERPGKPVAQFTAQREMVHLLRPASFHLQHGGPGDLCLGHRHRQMAQQADRRRPPG